MSQAQTKSPRLSLAKIVGGLRYESAALVWLPFVVVPIAVQEVFNPLDDKVRDDIAADRYN